LQRADVAAEPTWVVHVDCDILRTTAIGHYFLAEMEKPEAQSKLATIQTMFGFDPRKQLHGITLYSAGKVPEEGVLLVYGEFDANKLISMVSGAQDYQTTPYKKRVIHNWADEKKKPVKGVQPRVYAAIEGARIILIAQQEARVAEALDVLDRTAPSLAASGVFPQMGATASTNIIQAAARKLNLADSTPQAAILRLAKGAQLQVGAGQGQLRATLNLEANDPDVAQQMATVGQGLVALLKLQRGNAGLLKLAEAISLKQDGADLVASLSIPTGEVVELIKADEARKAQKAAEEQ
jgi:hypothetical protein